MRNYLWTDWDGNSDLQPETALQTPRNGWRTEYDAERDEWIVWPPYGGPARRYQRYPRPGVK